MSDVWIPGKLEDLLSNRQHICKERHRSYHNSRRCVLENYVYHIAQASKCSHVCITDLLYKSMIHKLRHGLQPNACSLDGYEIHVPTHSQRISLRNVALLIP